MIVESALPSVILGLVFLALYTRKSSSQVALGIVYEAAYVVCAQMIVLRVCMGRAWRMDTMTHLTDRKEKSRSEVVISDAAAAAVSFTEVFEVDTSMKTSNSQTTSVV